MSMHIFKNKEMKQLILKMTSKFEKIFWGSKSMQVKLDTKHFSFYKFLKNETQLNIHLKTKVVCSKRSFRP